MSIKHHKKWLALVLIIILLAAGLIRSKHSLSVSHYTISNPEFQSSIRILQLSDLHNSEFGRDNQRLIKKVQEQKPDLILLTGDIVNSDEERVDIAGNVIAELCKIAPVYCSNGNHEMEYEQNYGTDVDNLYQEAGATVLEKAYQDIEIKGQQIRLGGIYGYCLPEMYLATGEANESECAFLKDFQNTELPTILMCHMPVCWMINNGLDEWDVDFIFAGHVHGGEVILPFAGGLYGPDFGWFPGSLEGVFSSKDNSKKLVLSRGLGTSEKIPRFNNIPEIVVVDIQGKD